MQSEVRVRLISRVACSMCDDAREVVASVCADMGVAWDEVDVDADEDLRAQHGDHVPVVLVDGNQVAFWRVPEKRLRNFIRGSR